MTHTADQSVVHHFSKTIEEIDTAFFAAIFGDVGRYQRESSKKTNTVHPWLVLSFLTVPLSRMIDDDELFNGAFELQLQPASDSVAPVILGDTITAQLSIVSDEAVSAERVLTVQVELQKNHQDTLLTGRLILRAPQQ